jgi:SPP1 family phage portal protein
MDFINNENELTTPELIKIYIDEWEASNERRLMISGEKYYIVENEEILSRKMYRYEKENKVEDETKANHKLAHGFMHEFVDDKVNYLLVKPYTMECKEENYLKRVQDILGKRYQHRLAQLGTETSNKGIAWTYEYIDSKGDKRTMKVPAEQCIPWWTDNDHEELDAMIRYFQVEVYEGKKKKYVTKIEIHYPDGVEYYEKTGEGDIILDAEKYLSALDDSSIRSPHFFVGKEPGTWDRVPFVPWKNNDLELPDLQFVKTLVDEYDISRSDVGNLLEEIKQIIYVLRGYDGQDLSDFVRNLAYYHGIKLEADEYSGVDKIEHTVNIDAADKHYQQLLKDIYRFGQAVNKEQDKLGTAPSGKALEFLYSGLDLKCNAIEDNFKWSFEQQMYFINKYLEATRDAVKPSNVEISIVFNRDQAVNETEVITNCKNSMGTISNRTIVKNHPWVENLEDELKQIEKEGEPPEDDMINRNKKDLEANK